jgi:hypothetical protein
VDEEVMLREISDRARKLGGVETHVIKAILQRLMMRDLISSNPLYDPRIAIGIHHKEMD